MWLLVADSQIRDRQLLCTFNQRIDRVSVHGLAHEHQAHRAFPYSPFRERSLSASGWPSVRAFALARALS